MAQSSEKPRSAIDRSEKSGNIWLLVLLAIALPGAFLALNFVSDDEARLVIMGLLALLAVAGVFFIAAYAIGALQFSGRAARNDLTKAMADSSLEGLIAVEDTGRIVYANEAFMAFAGARDASDLKTVERLFVGAPEVSEAIYRLSQAAREHRALAEEIRLSPALAGREDFGWYRVRVRPLPPPRRCHGGVVERGRRYP